MPPRSSQLQNSFAVSDAENVVVCPLKNHDGSSCRKRCFGEKRYRSMQEHIRRAHPEHYISKLPATEESFNLMINTPPSERPPPPPPQPGHPNSQQVQPPYSSSSYRPTDRHSGHGGSRGSYNAYSTDGYSSATAGSDPRSSDEFRRGSLLPVESAAAALAQLHQFRAEAPGWESGEDVYSDGESYQKPHKNARFAPLLRNDEQIFDDDRYAHADGIPVPQRRELLPSSLARSPPGRSSTLPPGNRPVRPNRPRKSSVGQNARRPKHERTKSKELQKRFSHDRKAFSAEPQAAAMGRRWEDLIDAAASATEEDIREREDSRDRTPVPQGSPMLYNRSSIPPYMSAHLQSYTASPLARELTPPAQITDPTGPSGDLIPFPSVESSIDSSISFSHSHASNASGSNFHMTAQGLGSDSSPTQPSSIRPVEIYCALCKRPNLLRVSYACDACICGLCSACVSVLEGDRRAGGPRAPPGGGGGIGAASAPGECPLCRSTESAFRPVRFDIR